MIQKDNFKLNTAILFLVFNRIETTKQVFEAIRQAKPLRLYVAADGARDKKEEKKIKLVREYILSNIDWECKVKIFFRENNVGCGLNVKESIDWFFENEDRGIILEDDVVPSQSFFRFSEELLEKYLHDNRIGMISGNNHIQFIPEEVSYIFSKFYWTWGWATWQRSWKNMDFEMNWEKTNRRNDVLNNMGYTQKSIEYWENNIKSIKLKQVSAWDYQWFLSLSSQNQLCIFPSVNLVSNVGFGNDATHTFGLAPLKYISNEDIEFPLVHPTNILPIKKFEEKYEKVQVTIPSFWKKHIPNPIKKFIKNIIKIYNS